MILFVIIGMMTITRTNYLMHVIQAQESFTKIAEIDNRPHRTRRGERKDTMKEEKIIVAFIIAQIFLAIVSFALFATVLYVAWHFINKLW